MKFNEKLMELRKKEGLSQEELGYKLNVTRQTISKWELGQTTPEMDKLIEISKVFNISVDELLRENEETVNVDSSIDDGVIKNEKKNNKMYIIVLIAFIIVIACIVIKIISYFTSYNLFKKSADKALDQVDQVLGTQETEEIGGETLNFIQKLFKLANNDIDEQLEKQNSENKDNLNEIFNKNLKSYTGSQSGSDVKELLEKIIEINKTEDKKVTLKYNEIETQDTEELLNTKINMKDSSKFEVVVDYDDEKYINKVTLIRVYTSSEINDFNRNLEFYGGGTTSYVHKILDLIITSNKKEERKITVKYNQIETQDENEIRNIKRDFNNYKEVDISYEYDQNGFIVKATIENL